MQANADNEESESGAASIHQVTPPKPSASFATSLNVRIGLGIYGILLPIVCHLMTLSRAPMPARWQSGNWTDKLSFRIVRRVWLANFPVFDFRYDLHGNGDLQRN